MERMFLLGLVLTIVIATVVGRGYPHRPSGKSVCSLPMDPGRCKGSCPRYYYDTRTGKCRKFIYGCCGGNANNFRNERFCNWVCRNKCKHNNLLLCICCALIRAARVAKW